MIVALATSAPRSTVSSGMTHSCRLTPPCAYSAPAMKLPIPGGQAIRTSGFQYQGRTGTSGCDSPRTVAHRAHFVAVSDGGSTTFGRPPGINSQPWSVTTRTRLHPHCSSAAIRSTRMSSSSSMWRARSSPSLWPSSSRFPLSLQPATFVPGGRMNVVTVHHIDPSPAHLVSQPDDVRWLTRGGQYRREIVSH